MEQDAAGFVGLDVAKTRHAAAVAQGGRHGDGRYLGKFGAGAESVRRLAAKRESGTGAGYVSATKPDRLVTGSIGS